MLTRIFAGLRQDIGSNVLASGRPDQYKTP